MPKYKLTFAQQSVRNDVQALRDALLKAQTFLAESSDKILTRTAARKWIDYDEELNLFCVCPVTACMLAEHPALTVEDMYDYRVAFDAIPDMPDETYFDYKQMLLDLAEANVFPEDVPFHSSIEEYLLGMSGKHSLYDFYRGLTDWSNVFIMGRSSTSSVQSYVYNTLVDVHNYGIPELIEWCDEHLTFMNAYEENLNA